MKSRQAFTLVELLVVIAIIGILIALMLPGIQAAREAARRASCLNNLTNLGIALQNFEAAQNSLPSGVIDTKGPIASVPRGQHQGWLIFLLPYLDEQAAFQHVDLSVSVYDKKNEPVRNLRIGSLLCPSDAGGYYNEGSAPSNYAGCHHDVEAPIDADNHGVLFLNSRIRSTEIPDGASHTIVVGEKRLDPDDLGWMSGTRATLRNTGTPLSRTPLRTEDLPPEDEDGTQVEAPAEAPVLPADLEVGGFGSDHSGVTNLLFGDGTVHAMADATDPIVLQQLGHREDGKLLTDGPTRSQP
ncbi:MAG: DUF1559 domain-containing protein [Pirellulales bacterium]|nr:DUF1559 domain-containing protein [Pirellulales bacterium]